MRKILGMVIIGMLSTAQGAIYDWSATTPGAALNGNTNWTPNSVPGSGDTGVFAFSPGIATNPSLTAGAFTPGTFDFTDATDFTFSISGTGDFVFEGAGVMNSGGGTQTFDLSSTFYFQFQNTSSADSTNSGKVIYNVINTGAINNLQFQTNSSAGSAVINVMGALSTAFFNSNSTAATSTLNASDGGVILFNDSNGGNAAVNLSTGGILALGGFTPIGSLSSDSTGIVETNNFNLTFGSNNQSTTFAGTTTGIGTFTKVGTGTFTLSGAITSSTAVNAGTFVFTPPGTVGGDFVANSGGTVNGPGGDVSGSYTQQGGSFLLVTSAIPLEVGGTATINGGEVEVASGTYPLNTPFPILQSVGTLTGTYNGVASFNPKLVPTLTYDSHDVFLTLSPQFFVSAVMTPNQRAVASGLNFIGTTPAQTALLDALFSLSTADYLGALDQLSGVQYANLLQLGESSNRKFLREIFDPLRLDLADPCACSHCGERIVWADVQGGQSFLDKDYNAEGFKLYDGAFSAGTHFYLTPLLALGMAGNYEYDHIKFYQGGTGNGNTGQGALYGLITTPSWYLFGVGTGGYTHWSIERTLDFDSYIANPQGKLHIKHWSVYGEAGGYYYARSLLFQPFLGVEYGRYWRSEVVESGDSAANLLIGSHDTDDVESRLGGRIYKNCGQFLFSIDADWRHRYTHLGDHLDVSFVSFGPFFTILSPEQSRNAFEYSLYAATILRSRLLVYVEASGETSDRFTAYTVTLGLERGW